MIVIFEARPWRQAHQYAFGTSARAQAEQRATVVNKIELDISSAADLLPVTMPFGVRSVSATLYKREVSLHERLGILLRKLQPVTGITPYVIIKDSSHAPSLPAMFVHKILVAVLFEFRVMSSACPPEGIMEVIDILLEQIIWCKIAASAKPAITFDFEIPEVGVNRRHHWAKRM